MTRGKKNGELEPVTDEPFFDEPKPDEPKAKEVKPKPVKAPKVTVEEREGHAIASVDVPAHKAEVSVGHSAIDGVIAATLEAWAAVKGDDDAEFAACVAEFRQSLINHAEEVHGSGIVQEGDTVLARFEREVAKIFIREAEKAKAAKAA